MFIALLKYSVACTKYDTVVALRDYKQGKAKKLIFLTFEILTPTPAKITFFTLYGGNSQNFQ